MGDRTVLDEKLQQLMNKLEADSSVKTGMTLNIAINYGGRGEIIDAVRAFYAEWGALFILVKGLTPIPYKVVTIVSGALDYDFAMFVFLSVITRGARFFILAGLFNRFGGPIKYFIEKHLVAVTAGAIAVVVLGFVALGKLF